MRNFSLAPSFKISITFNDVFPYLMLIFMLCTFCLFSYAAEMPDVNEEENIALVKKKKRFSSPPEVSFLEPTNKRNYTTIQRKEFIKAYVKDVRKKKNIIVKVNGKRKRFITYKKKQNMLCLKVKLDRGRNFIEIIARNNVGEESKTMTVIYREAAALPVVEFASNGHASTTKSSFVVTADLQNVERHDDISILVNGVEQVFTYHVSSGILRSEIQLEMGNNRVDIIAYNRDGVKASDIRFIRRNRVNHNPSITMITPKTHAFKSSEDKIYIKATISNIEDANDIEFDFQGYPSTDFSFDPARKEFLALVYLQEGANHFTIRASNAYNTASRSGIIEYEYIETPVVEESYPPSIEMIQPLTKVNTQSNTLIIEANLFNIDARSQIKLNANGYNVYNFSYDASCGLFKTTQTLKAGYNYFVITIQNKDGQASHTVEADYMCVIQQPKPVLTMIHPTTNKVVSQKNISVKASVENIDHKSQITIRQNGQLNNNFYLSSGTFRYIEFEAVNLREGQNTIQITARNEVGTAHITTFVVYKKPQPVVHRPLVNITKPTNQIEVKQNKYAIEASVKNVQSKNDITVRVNGQTFHQFQFNPYTGLVKFIVPLKGGKNHIQVTAKNSAGAASDKAVVTYLTAEGAPKMTTTEKIKK